MLIIVRDLRALGHSCFRKGCVELMYAVTWGQDVFVS